VEGHQLVGVGGNPINNGLYAAEMQCQAREAVRLLVANRIRLLISHGHKRSH
jgi:hypothetical protein